MHQVFGSLACHAANLLSNEKVNLPQKKTKKKITRGVPKLSVAPKVQLLITHTVGMDNIHLSILDPANSQRSFQLF